MALFVSLAVYANENAAATINLGLPTSGAGPITFETYSATIAGATILSKITIPAAGLNQKSRVYFSTSTVAALVALMV
jgi:uncharacterized protein YbcV (DUF1398 family)